MESAILNLYKTTENQYANGSFFKLLFSCQPTLRIKVLLTYGK